MATGWDGRTVHDPRPDEVVPVWQVEPHPSDARFDCLIERSGPRMMDCLANNLDFLLERYEESELRSGVTITIKLVDMRADEIPE